MTQNRGTPALALVLAIAAAALTASPAAAQEKVKIAYLRGLQEISHLFAERQGYFNKEGIAAEMLTLNNGPAVISAVVSGSAEIGFAAAVPVINARAQNQPVKVFLMLDVEHAPDSIWNFLVASGRSGIKTLQDFRGKTVASNAASGGCDLDIRDHILAAGIPADALKMVAIPFPQMKAALELGTIDATCVIEPFYTDIMQSAKIGAVVLVTGMVADLATAGTVMNDGYFATDAWLAQNGKIAAGFTRAIAAANRDLAKDPVLYRKLIVDEFKLPAQLAEGISGNINTGSMAVEPRNIQPLIDAMVRTKMLTAPISAAEIVFPVTP
jgi:ABC-type nitrate/sulfonate/bicarbonate transport system substrate-binding protein